MLTIVLEKSGSSYNPSLLLQHGGSASKGIVTSNLYHIRLLMVIDGYIGSIYSHSFIILSINLYNINRLEPQPVASSLTAAGWLWDNSESCLRRLAAGKRHYNIRRGRRSAIGICLPGMSSCSGRLRK